MLQGIHYGDNMHLVHAMDPSNVQDLAGNAFQTWCCAASQLVLWLLRARAWQNATRQHPSAGPGPPSHTAAGDDSDSESLSSVLGPPAAHRGDLLDELLLGRQ